MARFCVRDGITHVVATPHCHRVTRLLRPDVLPRVVRLNEELSQASVPLTILPGSEVQVVDTAAYRSDFEADLYCHLGDGRAFTLPGIPPARASNTRPSGPQLVSWLLRQGMTPIVAHPERQGFFEEKPKRLRSLIEAGAWLQVTVDSLLGNHGLAPQSFGENLLRSYPETVLAIQTPTTTPLLWTVSWIHLGPGAVKSAKGLTSCESGRISYYRRWSTRASDTFAVA